MLVDADSLTARGFAQLPALLTPAQCDELIALYSDPDRFRTRIDMQQYRFGRGEYQYFRYPLPPIVDDLRHSLYAELAPIANQLVRPAPARRNSPTPSTRYWSAATRTARPAQRR